MKTLVLGKGIANDGVVMLLDEEKIEYDYFNIDEVSDFNYDLVVKAPGIPYTHSLIQGFLKTGIKVITDIELAYTLRKKFYIGVTGSNGKTTTVSLITHILSSKYKVIACGNIGYSICKALVEHQDADIFVVELSSFQLENAKIDLDISVILNIHPCHLDHHATYKEYIESKLNICLNQSSQHFTIYPMEDKILKEKIKTCQSNKITFSTVSSLANCNIFQDSMYYNGKRILKIKNDLKEKEFFLQDIMASISCVLLVKGITPKSIQRQLKTFEKVEYRLTKINDFIYNDAKSTNPYATIAALKCFETVFLICGGYDRKENLSCLEEYLYKIKRVYVYGQTKDKVYNYMTNHGVECLIFQSLDDAFSQAFRDRTDEIVLYSPMFASFDMFKNYMERGKNFNFIVSKYL